MIPRRLIDHVSAQNWIDRGRALDMRIFCRYNLPPWKIPVRGKPPLAARPPVLGRGGAAST